MKARLLCRLGEMKGSEFAIDSEATIGRSQSNSIVLESRSISSEHARIFSDDEAGHFVLEDLQSRNGTQLDGKMLRGRQALGELHVVNFGRSADFVFVVVREPEVVSDTPASQAAAAPPADSQLDDEPAGEDSSTLVDVEPLPLPASLAADAGETPASKSAAPGTAEPEEDAEPSRSDDTLVDHDSPELPTALRGDADERESPRGDG